MASGFGAGAGADALQEILRQKFTEAIQNARLQEEIRQADQRNAIAQQEMQNRSEDLGLRRQQMGIEQQRYDEAAPVRAMNLRLLGANAANAEGLDARTRAAQEATAALETRHEGFTAGENEKNRTNAVKIAGIRASASNASEPLVQVQGENGTIYVPRSQAAGMQAPAKTPPRMQASTASAIGQADASIHQLDKLEAMLPRVQQSIGPVAGRAAQMQQKIPGMPVDQNMAAFLAESATLRNATIKAITGAQMSEPEAQRIMSQIPSENDKPQVWIQKAKATRDNITFLRNKIASLYGVEQSGAPAKGADPLGIR